MISRKEIIIPSPRARRNTFHGNAVRIDRREKEGGRGGGGAARGEKSRKIAPRKRTCLLPPPTVVPVLREVTRSDR